MPLDFSQRPVVPRDVLMRPVAGESVLLDLKSETYFGLDEVGTRMWQVLASGLTLERACQVLSIEYAADPKLLRGDLEDLVERLVNHGLLDLYPAQSAPLEDSVPPGSSLPG